MGKNEEKKDYLAHVSVHQRAVRVAADQRLGGRGRQGRQLPAMGRGSGGRVEDGHLGSRQTHSGQ